MLHLLYILAFTVVAFFAVSNLIRSLLAVGTDAYGGKRQRSFQNANRRRAVYSVPHPELMDERGRPIEEPLLVMKSVSVDDARARLDAIYDSSPGGSELED